MAGNLAELLALMISVCLLHLLFPFFVWHSLIFPFFYFIHRSFVSSGYSVSWIRLRSKNRILAYCLKQGAEGVSKESICSCCLSFACFLNSLFASLQRVFASTFVGRKCVIKERFSKKYRHPLLDSKLTLKRLNAVSLSNQHVIIRFAFLHV